MHPPDSSAPSRSSLLAELRYGTRLQHAALDTGLNLQPSTVTRARYATFLQCMLSVVAPLEAALAQVSQWEHVFPTAVARRKTHLLVDDLEVLGLRASGPPIALVELPRIQSLAQAFGCAYVLEGSTLGGAVLARTLGLVLQLSPGSGLRFWTAYGHELGSRWREFVTVLEEWAVTVEACERVSAVDTAAATFQAFSLALQPVQICQTGATLA
jgi:heme oxygenase